MRTTLLLSTLAFTALAALTPPAIAEPGDLDLTFGGTGFVTTRIGSVERDSCHGVAVQSDGKIVAAGSARSSNHYVFAVVRCNADGSLDPTFGSNGIVTTPIRTPFGSNPDGANCLALQSDGKIVVAGYSYTDSNKSDFAVVRYNSDGSLDTTFNGTGKVTTSFGSGLAIASSIALQGDEKIVLAGWTNHTGNLDFALARYNADGSLDLTFGGTGKVTTDRRGEDDVAHSVAVDGDGKIVVAGYSNSAGPQVDYDFALLRYNADGSLDASFNGTGIVITDMGSNLAFSHGVALQADGKIVVAGRSYLMNRWLFATARFTPGGILDTTFNGTGKVFTSIGNADDDGLSVAIQTDGKIVVAGSSNSGTATSPNGDFAVVRYKTNGTLDTSFNGTGKVTTAIGSRGDSGTCVALQGDGKIVVAGYSDTGQSTSEFAIARYESESDLDGDGIVDRFETGTGIYVSPQDTGTSPTNADSDGDGLDDGQEVKTYLSNPNVFDTDGDGYGDGFEVSTGFSPTSAASTPDALSAILRAVEYRFSAALGISYRIESSTDLETWTTVETNIIGNGGIITRFYSIEGQARRFFRSRRN